MLKPKSRLLKATALTLAGAFVLLASGCIVIPDGYGYHGYRAYHGHHRHHGYYYDNDDGYRIRK